jgi:hypothetical protein
MEIILIRCRVVFPCIAYGESHVNDEKA